MLHVLNHNNIINKLVIKATVQWRSLCIVQLCLHGTCTHLSQESLEEKMAELNQKDSTINHREDDVDQIGVELQQKDNQLNQKEKELHLRMEEIQLKENSLQKKDTELGSMVEQVGQLKVYI